MRDDDLVIGEDPSRGFVLGQDPEEKAEREITQNTSGCSRCHRSWPTVLFTKAAERLREVFQKPLTSEQMESARPLADDVVLCDSCWPSDATTAIAEKIDEATGVQPAGSLIRSVEVSGIESKTNVASFKYATHVGGKELVTTLLTVGFKTKVPGEFLWYAYRDVPLVICEAMFAAPSIGSFFVSQIKNSYDSERKI